MASTSGKAPEIAEQSADREAPAPEGASEEIDIREIELRVEANIQRAMDTFDPWAFMRALEGDKPNPKGCTAERHKCKMDDDISKMCIGCAIYRKLAREYSACPISGSSMACDAFANRIAQPLIAGFLSNGSWMTPTDKLKGTWFIRAPFSFSRSEQNTMRVVPEVILRRNAIKLYSASAVMDSLGLTEVSETVLDSLKFHYDTKSGGTIYLYDDLLERLAPLRDIARAFNLIDLEDASKFSITRVIEGLIRIKLDM